MVNQTYRGLVLRITLGAILWIGLTACNAQTRAASSTVVTPTPVPAVMNVDEAQQVAADFLNAWTLDSYDGMYKLLTVNSHDAFARTDFEKAYTDAEHTMTLLPQGKSFDLISTVQVDTGVEVGYDMTFKTQLFGTFTDPGRVIHLVNTADGWRVAWSMGDIFAEMKDGGFLTLKQGTLTRGNIYDRAGDAIADENGFAVVVTLLTKTYPTGNPVDCFAALAQVFKARTADQLKAAYSRFNDKDVAVIVGELSPEALRTVRADLERACTLTYSNHPTRRYVAGGLAPHIVGYVGQIPAEQQDAWIARGYSPDALVGIDGVEHYYEGTLAGRPAAILNIQSASGSVRKLVQRDAQLSQSVYLTIDRPLQEALQTMLKDAFTTSSWGSASDGAAAIVMDIHTGEILAIASYPDFNVEAFNPNSSLKNAQDLINGWAKDPRKPTFNRATLGQYPPGSVFKIVSMAAAAGSGQFKLTTPITCGGVWNGGPLGDRKRTDWLPRGHGTITLKQALTGSCDIYFWNIGWTLNNVDPHILINYSKKMGFGAPTGVQDVTESTGGLPDPDTQLQRTGVKWRGSDALNTVIGQGDVTVTPLQVVRMVAAVANGGTLYQPLLVKKIDLLGNAPSYTAKPIPNGTLGLTPEVIQGIHDAMCEVTTNPTLGTAHFVFKGFTGAAVCGKTGTAQTGGAYSNPHAWFTAFAGKTADNPDIAVVVVVEHSGEGSYIAAPIVRRIVETYYHLPITAWPPWYGGGIPSLGGE